MRRFCAILLFFALSQYVECSLITDRVTKDVPMQDAEIEENNVVVPMVVPVESVPELNSVAENVACAKVGEFCMNHKDCCSNACLGYMKRCVSARELTEDDE